MSPLTLEKVKNNFEAWRSRKNGNGDKIPEALWKQMLKLIGHYPINKIIKTLRISGTQFTKKRYEHAQLSLKATPKKSVKFIELPSSQQTPVTSVNFGSCNKIEIKRVDGVSATAVNLQEQTLIQILTKFIG